MGEVHNPATRLGEALAPCHLLRIYKLYKTHVCTIAYIYISVYNQHLIHQIGQLNVWGVLLGVHWWPDRFGRKEMLNDLEALESMMKEWKGQWSAGCT